MDQHRAGLRRVAMAMAGLFVFFVIVARVRSAAEAPADDAKAKKAIQEVLDAQQAAWNKGDLDGFMVGYWKSDDLSFYSGGDKTKGWQATLERYEKKYKSDGKEMGALAFSELDIRVLGDENALVRGRWQLKFKDGKTAGGLYTLWLRKLPEGWRIVHDHTSKAD
jgi:beta-aspartyl-peptidase (threonine type)